jgi:hypothetical protein
MRLPAGHFRHEDVEQGPRRVLLAAYAWIARRASHDPSLLPAPLGFRTVRSPTTAYGEGGADRHSGARSVNSPASPGAAPSMGRNRVAMTAWQPAGSRSTVAVGLANALLPHGSRC